MSGSNDRPPGASPGLEPLKIPGGVTAARIWPRPLFRRRPISCGRRIVGLRGRGAGDVFGHDGGIPGSPAK